MPQMKVKAFLQKNLSESRFFVCKTYSRVKYDLQFWYIMEKN